MGGLGACDAGTTRVREARDGSDTWALVEQAKAGDADAYGRLYQRYSETVRRFVYFRTGSSQVAEDLTAETFLRGWRRIGTVTWQGRDFGAWLTTIARNLVADYFKSGKYRYEVPASDVLAGERPELRDDQLGPAMAAVAMLRNVALADALMQLTEPQRECVTLRFLQEMSVSEVAQRMGKNEGAVKALQTRAVASLARLMPSWRTA